MALNLAPNPAVADDLYETIIRLHDGLTDAESAAANARLILILAHHIGDPEVVRDAAALARMDTDRGA